MVNKTKNPNVEPHDLWLAGLGVVSLTRKQAIKAYDVLVKEGAQFRADAGKRIDTLATQARASFDEVKSKVEARVEPVLTRANEAYDAVKHEVEVRLAPVVDIFDHDKNVAAKAAKPVARKRPAAKKAPATKKPVSAKKTTATSKTAAKAVKKPAPQRATKKAA